MGNKLVGLELTKTHVGISASCDGYAYQNPYGLSSQPLERATDMYVSITHVPNDCSAVLKQILGMLRLARFSISCS